MPINYPTSLDTATELPSPSTGGVIPASADTNRSLGIIALETKLGIGDSAAALGSAKDALMNDGSGGSAWRALVEADISDLGTYLTSASIDTIAELNTIVNDATIATTTTKLDDFGTPDDNTDLDVTTSYHGLVPKAPGGSTQFLRADATWATPSVGASSNVDVTVWNATGATLTKFSAVYLSGWNIANALPEVTDAQADSSATMPGFGIVTGDIANGASGTVTVVGNVGGLVTNGYSEGDALYVDPATPGAVTSTKPTGANLIQKIAIVTRSHATLGTIQVFGAGRTNDIPNFTAADKYWYGGTDGVATEGDITSPVRTFMALADPTASTTQEGIVELATGAETNTGTDATRAVTPDGLDDWTGSAQITTLGTISSGDVDAAVSAASDTAAGKAELATSAELDTGTDTGRTVTPEAIKSAKNVPHVVPGADGNVLTSDGTDWVSETPAAGGGQTLYDAVLATSGGDYTDLSTALAAMSAGETLFVRSGTYAETTTVTLATANLTIVGENPETTILEFGGSAVYHAISSANLTLSNIGIKSSTTGRTTFSGNEMRVIGCNLDVTGGDYNLVFSGTWGLITNNHFRCTLTSPSRAIAFNNTYGSVTNNHFYFSDISNDGTYGAIYINGGNSNFTGNSAIASASGTGAFISANAICTITGNHVTQSNDSDGVGIRANTSYIVITGNTISNFHEGVRTAATTTVSGNYILADNTSGVGVSVAGDDCSVTGNIIRGATGGTSIGINVESAIDDCIVSGNRIITFNDGIIITDAGNVNNIVTSNQMQSCTSGLTDTGTTTSTNNNV